MLLAFLDICTLLSRCEDIETHDPPYLPKEKSDRLAQTVQSWLTSHRRHINELDVQGATALLSFLLPERRTDRVYGFQALGLCRILGRSLTFSAARIRDLQAYKDSGKGDLGLCLERALLVGGPPALPAVSIQDVDDMLQTLAGQYRFSGLEVRLPPGSSESRDKVIANVFKRVSPCEGKWLVRLLLKDLSPLSMNETVVLKAFHFLLPDLLRFQQNFGAAVSLLKTDLREYHACPDVRSERLLRRGAAALLQPAVGIKVGRPDFFKARSIEHCMKMVGGRRWVLERKYDGEYCEVHIDLGRSKIPFECIQIYSKSGKDSTADRQGIHQTLVDCLRLGRPDCKVKQRAIILGELVVFSDQEVCIAPFDKIRRHVSRSGVFLGTDQDSPPHSYEHLAIVFFDLLLLDNEVVMRRPVDERRNWLRELYRKIPGRAMGAEWKIVDFSEAKLAKRRLVDQFAASIARRCEGLVLKPCEVPYFPLGSSAGDGFSGFIKLKKDYINGLGDEADFAVVGASYNAQHAARCGVKGVKWTKFHLGCVVNASDVRRFDSRPVFKLVGSIQQEACIPKTILSDLNRLGANLARPYEIAEQPPGYDLQDQNAVRMDVTFDDPFVLEVLGSGFETPSNCAFYMLRHARVKKLHRDRTWKDCISFQALQEQASAARAAPDHSESQETRHWLAKLEKGHKRKFDHERTPKSASTVRSSVTRQDVAGPSVTSRRLSTPLSPSVRDPPLTLELDGTTLVETTSVKRKREDENTQRTSVLQISSKRPRTESKHLQATTRLAQPEHVLQCPAEMRPLSDITNRTATSKVSARPNEMKPVAVEERHIRRSRAGYPQQSKIRAVRGALACADSRCLLSNTVLFLSPCISGTPYITEDLIPTHETTIARDITHWDRESFAHPPLTPTVSESQAYPDCRKIVLVEMKRPLVVRQIVQRIMALNGGRLRERVEVYDWRVLEECGTHSVGAEAVKPHFVGATVFDEVQERSLFVSQIPWLQV